MNSAMRPQLLDLLFHDDRMFVFEVFPVETDSLTSDDAPLRKWAVIRYRNVHGYPPASTVRFLTYAGAIDYFQQTVIGTSRVSLGERAPDPLPTIDENAKRLISEELFDPLLNPISRQSD
jgi:hypothetical protein